MSWRATDLPPPGSPPISMFRSARVTSTRRPSSSVPRWTGFQIDSGATGKESSAIAVHLPGGPWRQRAGWDEDDECLVAVRANRAAAGRAGVLGCRLVTGRCLQTGDALVAE